MSLVNEALKRARAEAEEHEARRTGAPLPSPIPTGSHASTRANRWSTILAVLAGVFLVGVLAGAVAFVRNRAVESVEANESSQPSGQVTAEPAQRSGTSQSGTTPTKATRATPSAVNPTIAPPATAPEAVVEAPPSPSQAPQTQASSSGASGSKRVSSPTQEPPRSVVPPTGTPPTSTPASTRSRSASSTPTAASPAEADQPVTADSTEDSGLAGVREATAADGRTLSLGGIAWSDSGPFALVNGRVLAAGERIEGFQVTEIQREWVRLEDDGETIVLRLR